MINVVDLLVEAIAEGESKIRMVESVEEDGITEYVLTRDQAVEALDSCTACSMKSVLDNWATEVDE